ncbi:MAG: T9SS type A sorting domain-containing protein [Bacteroidota bacterium]
MKSLYMLILGTLLVSLQTLHAQCIKTTNCPDFQSFCDESTNNAGLWSNTGFYSYGYDTYDLAESAVDLSVTAFDSCTGGSLSFRYELRLDLNDDGIAETLIDSKSPPPAGFVYFNGTSRRAFDLRAVPFTFKYRFGMQVTHNNGVYTARVRWTNFSALSSFQAPQLPYGGHEIKWFVKDVAGHEVVCAQSFYVNDCKKPLVHCLNNQTVNISPAHVAYIHPNDLLQDATDNVTPTSKLRFGLRKAGTGTSFPAMSGYSVTQVIYTCSELGQQNVELWAKDQAGNTDFCTATITVKNDSNECNNITLNRLCAKSVCSNAQIQGVHFEMVPAHNAIPIFLNPNTAEDCLTTLDIPDGDNWTAIPSKDNYPLNGVTNADLLLIQKHLDGTQPFTEPWQWVAADIDNSKSITQNDVIELNKLLTGVYTELPSNTSWRFVRDDYVFPAGNPLSAPVPYIFTIEELQLNPDTPTRYVLGIKIGDLDCSAMPNVGPVVEDRKPEPLKSRSIALPAQPNPSSGAVVITVIAEQASKVDLDVFDLNGKLIFHTGQSVEDGVQYLNIPAEAFPVIGLYPYQLRVGAQVFNGKIVQIK